MQKRCRIISLVIFLLVEFMMPISYASENSVEEDFSLEENIEAATSEEESNSEGDGSSEVIDENLGEETEDETVEDEIKEEKEEVKESVEDVEEKDSVETDVNIEGGNDEEPEEGDGENLGLEDEEKVEDESDAENDENNGDKDLEETGTGDEEISGTGNRETLGSGDSEALETGDLDDERGDTNDNVEGDNEPKEDEHGTAELDDGVGKDEEENSEGDENLKFESLESPIDVVAMLLGEPLMAMAPVTFVNYEDNVTTYVDTQGNEFEMGAITITNGVDSVTILDRNLGASTNDINSSDSFGYHFQWGNNYGFANNVTPQTSTTQVNASSYGWSNPYVGNIFIKANNWDSSNNSNLWGGALDFSNNWSEDTTNQGYRRQGPCPEGYHVPSEGERNKLMILYWNSKGWGSDLQYGNNNLLFVLNLSEKISEFRNDLKIPFGGIRNYNDGNFIGSNLANLWSSSFNAGRAYYFYFIGSERTATSTDDLAPGYGFSVRCFKNSENEDSVILSFETNGGQKMPGQTVPLNGTAHAIGYNPVKIGASFDGWYKDEELTQPFQFGVDVLTEDTTIYAKWLEAGISYQDNVTTYIDTQGNEFSMGTITYVDDDGNSKIILDRNLGATAKGTGETAYGYYFQWGNNYGFANNITPNVSMTPVNASNYSWSNPYVSNIFIGSNSNPYNWSTVNNVNLWGGINQSNPDYMRQGPCPPKYHIPTATEVENFFLNFDTIGENMNNAFLMPYAGSFAHNNGIESERGERSMLWLSTPNNTAPTFLDFYSNINARIIGAYRTWGFNIRCFADTTPNEVILSFETNGGQKIQGQAVPLNGTAHVIGYDPEKDGYTFGGWYKDEEFTQPFQFGVDVLTEDTTLYAKWNKPRCQNQGTQYSGVVWNCEEGTITVTNGSQSITMKDMNVGAIEVGYGKTASTSSYGLYYQWGGMTGYEYSLTANQAKAKGFITNNTAYSASTSGWTREQQIEMCGEGYHIPTKDELLSVYNMLNSNGITNANNIISALKLPFAGYRNSSDASMKLAGNTTNSVIDVWSSVSDNTTSAYGVYATTSIAYFNRYSRAYGYPIRCFKDVETYTVTFDSDGGTEVESIVVEENSVISQPTNPTKSGYTFSGWYLSGTDELWNFSINIITGDITLYAKWNKPRCQNQGTQYSGVVWNCEEGTITVTNGGQSITMKDMNVGATEVGYGKTASTGSYGLYYQWGGMTGYEYSLTAAQAKAKGFITNNTTYSSNTSGVVERNIGPCSTGYHIPTEAEWGAVLSMLNSNGLTNVNDKISALKIPFAGYRSTTDAAMKLAGSTSNSVIDLWLANQNSNNSAYRLYASSSTMYTDTYNRANGFSIRCFQDREFQTYIVTFDSDGGTEVESIVVEENSVISQPTNPTKSGYTFSGWYLSGTDELWNFSINIITGDITLYAKWKNNEPLSVSAPNLITFPSITVPRIVMAVDVNVNDYFLVKDPIGSESGWRITIEATDLSGSLSVIDKSNIYLKAGALETVGELNEAVHINQNLIDDFVSLGTPINYIYRTTTTNHKTGEYRDKPTLRVKVPAYQSADTYSGKIVVTLYEN